MSKEYTEIINPIIKNKEFIKLKEEKHHSTNRYSHSLSVSFLTYKVTRKLNLNYTSATRAALLHDFYLNEQFIDNKRLFSHPNKALINSLSLMDLNELEQNIITSHMFPFGGTLPKYKESIIVDIIDDYVSIKERTTVFFKYTVAALNFLIIMFLIKK